MCHLAIEKSLKGIYEKIEKKIPPKSHSLIYFVQKLNLDLPENLSIFLIKINQASITTRYPENIEELQKNYTKEVVAEIINNTNEIIEWINQKYYQ